MPYISDVYARVVLDSNGNPTIEVEISTESGAFGRATVPYFNSSNNIAAKELRDNDDKCPFISNVNKAVDNVNNVIGPRLIGLDVREQIAIDHKMEELDGTPNFIKLGANAILGVSIATSIAAADYNRQQLYEYYGGFNAHKIPCPVVSIYNNPSFGDLLIIPSGFESFFEALRAASIITRSFKNNKLEPKNINDAFNKIVKAITSVGYKPGEDIYLGLDANAQNYYNPNTKKYLLKQDNKSLSASELMAYYEDLVNNYPIIYLEDALDNSELDNYEQLTKRLGNKIMIVADEAIATQSSRLTYALSHNIANTVCVKPCYSGNLTKTFDFIETAKKAGYNIVLSSQRIDSEDTTIADIAVGVNANFVKFGSTSHLESTSKYNQLLRIEDTLGASSEFNNQITK